MPQVSIIIPTYKRAQQLRRILTSIVRQTFKDYEVIIIDDCSPNIDEYEQVIAEYRKTITYLTYIRNEKNYGTPTHARNVGAHIAQGEYIAFCDDDDEWYPLKLQRQVEKFEKYGKEYGLMYTWADTVDDKTGNVISRYRGNIEGNCIRELLRKDFIPTSSVMVRKADFLAVDGMDERMVYCCEDWDTWLRMLKNGSKCGVVQEVLLKYYRNDGDCFSMLPGISKGYIQFYRKHIGYALKEDPFAALAYVKHIVSIYIRKR